MPPRKSRKTDPSLLTDEQVVARLKRGDREAGGQIVQRHHRLVARAIYNVVRDLTAVEDLIQDVFMKTFRKIHLYNPEIGKFTVWLTTVARNEAINHIRRRKRARHISLDDTAPEGGYSPLDRPSQQASKKETWGRVYDIIHELPEPPKTVLTMRILESTPFDKIARALKLPVDTVKTIYYRNTEALRKRLGTSQK